ncbi:hypothetical protein JRQ81_012279 [Phrynocephalus forsythii]|uniref:Uncharacterized protein n=1 Tax=Phrynocephalus forsythii TaxID=171643 RepID=A0A9Q0X7J1_9SAUR|nr:hypothetical protein JRQ81_012279 [Phrynocephalus forsythii]
MGPVTCALPAGLSLGAEKRRLFLTKFPVAEKAPLDTGKEAALGMITLDSEGRPLRKVTGRQRPQNSRLLLFPVEQKPLSGHLVSLDIIAVSAYKD